MANYNAALREPRIGICLHYDASASDKGAVEWLTKDPRCKVSYNLLVLDNANIVEVAPVTARAWHAGVCRSSDHRLPYTDANSALYGIAIAATDGDVATDVQVRSVVALCRTLFQRHGWHYATDVWRIVGHETECWPRGRKHDPTGSDPKHPVLSVLAVRGMMATGALEIDTR